MCNSLKVAIDPVCPDTAKIERVIQVYSPEIAAFDTLVYVFPATHRGLVTVHIEGIIIVI